MKKTMLCLVFGSFCLAAGAVAQTTTAPADLQNPRLSPTPTAAQRAAKKSSSADRKSETVQQKLRAKEVTKPFSRIGLSGGISLMGGNMQVATNLTRHLNVRGVGNYFSYTMKNREIDDYTVNGTANFATGGVSLDYFPFVHHGFRLSPGVMFYNDNHIVGDVTVKGGTELTLNDYDYYSSTSDPIKGNASLKLNKRKTAPTVTLGWGNLIPRRGGHWSFPFELGVALVDKPEINVALTSGQACDAMGANCVNVATDPTMQANLTAQVDKYRKDLEPLQFYPIISFGVGYNFRIRH